MAVGTVTSDPSLRAYENLLIAIGRQFPFATAKALNDVAIDFQNRQRAWQEQVFTIREKQFFRFSVKFANRDRATPKRMTAIIHIDDSVRRVKGFGSQRRPDIWQRLQFDEKRLPKSGNKKLAIPTEEVERTGRDLVKKREFPNQLAKRKRDFTVPFPGGGVGLFERLGKRQKAYVKPTPGKRLSLKDDPNVRFLYYLAPEADLRPAFNFYHNAKLAWGATFNRQWQVRIGEAFRNIKIPRLK